MIFCLFSCLKEVIFLACRHKVNFHKSIFCTLPPCSHPLLWLNFSNNLWTRVLNHRHHHLHREISCIGSKVLGDKSVKKSIYKKFSIYWNLRFFGYFTNWMHSGFPFLWGSVEWFTALHLLSQTFSHMHSFSHKKTADLT